MAKIILKSFIEFRFIPELKEKFSNIEAVKRPLIIDKDIPSPF